MSRSLDTLAVFRALGAREVAGAVVRRISRPLRAHPQSVGPADVARFSQAFRVAPSPVLEEDDEQRMRMLERETPGICAHIRARAEAAAEGVETDRSGLGPEVLGDPRLAWEPHRLGRLVLVAAGVRAAATRAEADALRGAFERGFLSWSDAHGLCEGEAWASPLEAALRAWNLWVAASLARIPLLSKRASRELARQLAQHGRFIEARLEDRGLVIGTHLVGELVGLYACGAALGAAGGEPGAWRALARRRLEEETFRQVLPDGGGAEASTGYSRFVFELLVAAIACARARSEPAPQAVVCGARSLAGFLLGTMTPAGGDPGVGDDDDSRVLPPGVRPARDLLGLAPLAAALLGARERPLGVAWTEEAAWLAGSPGYRQFSCARVVGWPSSVGASDFGLAVGRQGGLHGDCVTLRAGPHGQRGVGGHAHNDPLSVTIWLSGRPVVVDPGTGVYLGRRALRDRFRGVAAHGAVAIDRREPSPILRSRPFALPDVTHARLLTTGDDGGGWAAVGEHEGYARHGVRHRREVRFDRQAGSVRIIDRLESSRGVDSEHEIALCFPLGPGDAELVGERVRLGSGGEPWAWIGAADDVPIPWRLDRAAVSPRYGAVTAGWSARRVGRVTLPVVLVTEVKR